MTNTLTAPRAFHHTQIKRAAKHGVTLEMLPDGGIGLIETATGFRALESFDTTAEAFEALDEKAITFEAPKPPRSGRSGVMAIGYHARYSANPEGPGCNDGLDIAFRDRIMVPNRNEAGEITKGEHADVGLIREIAEANGVWVSRWADLNPGMMRMNTANRLRALLRNDPEATVDLAGTIGRFGVAHRPSKKAAKKAARAAKLIAQEVKAEEAA